MMIARNFHAAVVAGLLALTGCAGTLSRPVLPHQMAIPAQTGTPLDAAIEPAEVRHAGQSGFRLVSEGPESFAIRARTAEVAGRSLDVQTYIWHDDLTGMVLAWWLVKAADRGVRVRLLLDDWDARGHQRVFAALDAHPRIEVRMFNPFASRVGTLGFATELLGNFRQLNRRMHNKTWIADNRIAIAGGRNIGNEYFGASDEVNFVDLDFAMVGPVVREASDSFDRYWNSELAFPVAVLAADVATPEALAAFRERATAQAPAIMQTPYARELRGDDAVRRVVEGDWAMEWVARSRFVADDPAKVLGKGQGPGGSRVLESLLPMTDQARRDLTVISPYFVPGKAGTAQLVGVAARGVEVRVLTNSLAANDVAAVYGGYSRWRKPLLQGGVKLWEIKPEPGTVSESSLFGSTGASLHTKSLSVDGHLLFVGSFNLDPRSASLNTEQGVFVDSPALARHFQSLFAADTEGSRAWAVGLEGDELRWTDAQDTLARTPQASTWRKVQAWFARVLPLESQL